MMSLHALIIMTDVLPIRAKHTSLFCECSSIFSTLHLHGSESLRILKSELDVD